MNGDNTKCDGNTLLDVKKRKQKPKKPKKSNCCSIRFLECVIHIFNVVFSLTGLGLLAVGIYCLITRHRYLILLSSMSYTVITYVFIICGSLAVPLCALGTAGVKKKNRTSLLCYAYFVLFTFIAEAGAGGLAYYYEIKVHSEIDATLNKTFLENFNVDVKITRAINELQIEYSCCGSHRFSDWLKSTWKMATFDEKRLVPDSCCITPSRLCGKRDHPSNIHHKSCAPYLISFIREPLGLLAAVGLGTSVVPAFGIIFSCWLYVAMSRLHA